MTISKEEQLAIGLVLDAAATHGYGNLISHLQTAWARTLMTNYGLNEEAARAATGGAGYPFAMQADLVERGEWDETGRAYRKAAAKGTV